MEDNPIDAERMMLSAMLQSRDAIWEALDIVPFDQLLEPRHSSIALALHTLADEDHPTDVIAAVDELTRRGELNRVGGASYLHTLYGEAPTSANVGYYADIVRAEIERRRLLAASTTIKELANDLQVSATERAERSRAVVDDALDIPSNDIPDPGASLRETYEAIGHTHPGVPTPWPKLTHMLGGFTPGSLYVLGARPAIGKSGLALQCASTMQQFGYVAYFSLEMSTYELNQRLIAQNTTTSLKKLRRGKALDPEDADRVEAWLTLGGPHRILIDDRSGVTSEDINQRVRTFSRKYQLSGVIVDHMQLMAGGSKSNENRTQQITEISRQLKVLARNFQVPVIALSQLNRQAVDRPPVMSDLRESGAIEQDADVVFLLDRDDDEDHMGNIIMSTMHLEVAKHRQGPTGRVDLDWQGEFVRGVEL